MAHTLIPPTNLEPDILEPETCRARFAAPIDMWVYRYTNSSGDVLCVGTHGRPGSGNLSLGGFRIVPPARAALPGFSPEQESVGLGVGMEEKAYWSKLLKIAGPLGRSELHKVVGGKCVLLPAANGRVGESRDVATLSWALDCLMDLEERAGIRLVTGQDLGHGVLSNGETSLAFMSSRYRGVVIADTSKPTGEGNYQLMRGFADAAKLDWSKLHFGILGCGNIGEHLVQKLRADTGATITVLEAKAATRTALSDIGVTALAETEKERFLQLPIDLFAVNAVGGTLDSESCVMLASNKQCKLVSGCENLVMPDANGAETLRLAKKLYVHTELCGMMGYLTAVENYLARNTNQPFNVSVMFEAATGLREVGRKVSEAVLKEGFARGFEDVAREVYRG
jgi:hypothetical protein